METEEKMRTALTVLMSLLLAANAYGVSKNKKGTTQVKRVVVQQSEPESVRLGWYLSPALKFGKIDGETETMLGIRGGLEFNQSIYLGLAAYGLPEDKYDDPFHDRYFDDDEWAMGYGGLEVGLISGRPRNGQISLGVLIGGGSVNIDENYFESHFGDYDGFFVLEPQMDMTLSFSRNVRLSLGASYRFIDDLESVRYSVDDLEGPSFNLTLGLGRF